MQKITTMLAVLFIAGVLTACSDNGNNNASSEDNQNVAQNDNSEIDNNSESNDTVENDINNGSEATENNSDGHSDKYDDAVDDNDAATKKMKELNIEEIEIEYSSNKEYEAEIELKSDGTYTSELEDDLNDEYIKGQEAFDKLYPMVKELDLNEDSSKDEVFDQILKAFDLDGDYEKIEVEINFHDSEQELEYKDK